MNTVLNVKDLCKTYVINKKQNNVLRNVNFSMNEGEMVAVMGPSGSGKSTLLYTVSGMDNPTAGKVTFFDKDISSLSKDEMSDIRLTEMGFIFQQMYMLKNLSIYDNIILPAYQAKNGKGSHAGNVESGQVGNIKGSSAKIKINEYAKELMRKMNIIDIADNDINEVSGGQLQRACICRSLINNPKMIFADEPTGSLNKQASIDVMNEIIRVNKEGTTVLLVTHDVRVAVKSERILYIVDGNIRGEYNLGKFGEEQEVRERERALNNWLLDMGW